MEEERFPRRQPPKEFGARRRTPHGKEELRVKRIQPYRQTDKTLHPRIYHGHSLAPSQRILQRSPMFTVVHNPKKPHLDSHVIMAVAVQREREDKPGSFVSAVGTVFSDYSAFNQARAIEETNFVHAQIKAVYDAILSAYNASNHMKFQGCKSVVIMIDKEMEWLARVLCRYHELQERAAYDEIKLREYFRYPELITQLNGVIEGFEGTTMLRVQFWPTNKEELGFAYQLVNKALDLHLSPCYDDGIFDDHTMEEFDASEYGSDYSIEDEELIDSINDYGEDDGFATSQSDFVGVDLMIKVKEDVEGLQKQLQDEDEIGVEPGFALPGEDSRAGTPPNISTNNNTANNSTNTTPITPPEPIPTITSTMPVTTITITTDTTTVITLPDLVDLPDIEPLIISQATTTPPDDNQLQLRAHSVPETEPETPPSSQPEMQQIKPLNLNKAVKSSLSLQHINPIASILASLPIPTTAAAKSLVSLNLHKTWLLPDFSFEKEVEDLDMDMGISMGMEIDLDRDRNMVVGIALPLPIHPPPRKHQALRLSPAQKDIKPEDKEQEKAKEKPSKIPKQKSTHALLPSPMPRPTSISPAAAALSLCGVLAQAVSSIGDLGRNRGGAGRLGRLGIH